MEKILLDTDIGGDIDDAICLAYLLREPRCHLLGITTVGGEPERRAAVADAICRAAGKTAPIVAGLDSTLQPVPGYPTPEGARALDRWEHANFVKGDAPAFLYRMITEHPHEAILIGIGHMTNIATLFRDYPDAPGLLKELVVMNGYFGGEALPEPWYNWNSWADPLASKIVFAAEPVIHRAVPLDVTGGLTLSADEFHELFPSQSPLMKAVLDFGAPWLESSGQLTFHDPLAALAVFHPDLCRLERGRVSVATTGESSMGETVFTADPEGNVEIARDVDRERFYRLLSGALCPRKGKRVPPPLVVKRVEAAGSVGAEWLASLDSLISTLEEQWQISVDGEALSGGSTAYVAHCTGPNGEQYVLKADMPESMGHGSFVHSVNALKLADGRGYAKLIACDWEKRAYLTERLGKPLKNLGYSVREQLRAICDTLHQTWQIPTTGLSLPTGDDSTAWFRDFIGTTWESLGRPCPESVIRQAFRFLQSREENQRPEEYVLVHGDAHGSNALEDLTAGSGFKLIDPDGLFYEKAYDLGVLMREWPEEYRENPLEKGRERCGYLSRLTGVDSQGIWEWGFLQTVSTAFVLLQTGRAELGAEMLNTARAWCGGQ